MNIFRCGSDPSVLKCDNCGKEVKRKELKETFRCVDIDDGYEEYYYECPTCKSRIILYFN